MSYTFQDPISNAIQRAVIQETMRLTKAGVFTLSELAKSTSTYYQQADYNFSGKYNTNTEEYDNQGVSSFLDNTQKLVQIRFESLYYFENDGTVRETDPLDIHICQIDFSQKYDVIRTKILNEKGTIKEVWAGGDDASITISGVLIGDFGVIDGLNFLSLRPIKEINNLMNICNSNVPVIITCPYLNLLGVNALQIDSIDLPYEPEFKNIQRFRIKAFSHNQNLKIGI